MRKLTKANSSKPITMNLKCPSTNKPIIESSIGYQVRSGVHGLELYDWEQYMKFIEYHFLKIPVRNINDVYSIYE